MSQGAEKSQPPEMGIEPGLQDLKANTLPRRCKSRLLPQGSRSGLYLPIPTTYGEMSQGAEKSQPPEMGIEPGPQDLKANTLPRRCKSRLLPQGSRSVLYLPIPTTYKP